MVRLRPGHPELLTVGHGTLNRDQLAAQLEGAGVRTLVDVRRFPNSRHNPDVARESMAEWLPSVGIDYRWDERLGGRRRLEKDTQTKDGWWRVESFRAYAAHTRSRDFADAMDDLVGAVGHGTTAVMCSESVWWRCHRRLIADVAVLVHDLDVRHLMPGGRLTPHKPSEGARSLGQGQLVWDGASG